MMENIDAPEVRQKLALAAGNQWTRNIDTEEDSFPSRNEAGFAKKPAGLIRTGESKIGRLTRKRPRCTSSANGYGPDGGRRAKHRGETSLSHKISKHTRQCTLKMLPASLPPKVMRRSKLDRVDGKAKPPRRWPRERGERKGGL